MSKLLSVLSKVKISNYKSLCLENKIQFRTFLSAAYQCNDAWANRLNNPILQKVNLDELYHSLDQRFNKSRQISAVDVDIFANAVKDDLFIDELLDLVHKLRLSVETANALDSMTHAVIRILCQYKKYDELLNILDDRLNYGLFLDDYTANYLLDIFWKNKNYAAGVRVASQFMLQEDFRHPLTKALSLIHCYNYLLKPENWPVLPPPDEPEEEVKVRVKYLRNPYDDDHFDLKDPMKIIGKTLIFITRDANDSSLNKTFSVLGYTLYGKLDKAKEVLKSIQEKNIPLCKDIVDLLPSDSEMKNEISSLKCEPVDVLSVLTSNVQEAIKNTVEGDIKVQHQVFEKWEKDRLEALAKQKERLDKLRRLEEIDKLQKDLKDRETKLWFFENEEKIELDIEAKKIYYPKRWFGKKKKPRKVDEGYVPPEVSARVTTK